jgi:hypothetical protein
MAGQAPKKTLKRFASVSSLLRACTERFGAPALAFLKLSKRLRILDFFAPDRIVL